ncbi:MAG: M23 family metallopeptidase [Rhodothermales bacterium]
MSKNRYYYYDPEQCAFVEAKPSRKRYVGYGLAVFALAIAIATVLVLTLDQTVGSPEEVALESENEALRDELEHFIARMDTMSEAVEYLAEVDQTLYRTMLDAEAIPQDIREAGVGGSSPYSAFDGFSETTSSLLREAATRLDQLERQVNFQNESYRELSGLAEEHSAWLDELPAIIPADGPILSHFGVRSDPFLGTKKMHHGLDIIVERGSPIYAAGNGVIKETGRSPSYGIFVEVEHSTTGYTTFYAHLSGIPSGIREGVKVERGQQVGISGSTGRSKGPHLHYEVRDSEGRKVNPIYFLTPNMTPAKYKELLQASEASTIAFD